MSRLSREHAPPTFLISQAYTCCHNVYRALLTANGIVSYPASSLLNECNAEVGPQGK